MSEESAKPAQPPATDKPGKASRRGAIIVLILIVVSLMWYFVSDRLRYRA